MTKAVLVIADDVTGGNSTAAGLAQHGYRAVAVLDTALGSINELVDSYDAVVVSTGTRNSSSRSAATAVHDALAVTQGFAHVSLRIDSTLRGPIAASVHSVLRGREAQTGRRTVGICVAAHPAAGRETVNGHQLLWGRDLTATELVLDRLSPVISSSVLSAVAHNDLTVAHIGLDDVNRGVQHLATTLAGTLAGSDVVVVDATTINHITSIAEASLCVDGDIETVAIDPGPFTVERARILLDNSQQDRPQRDDLPYEGTGPVLLVVGSASDLTAQQLAAVTEQRRVVAIEAEVDSAGELHDPAAIDDAITRSCQIKDAPEVIVVAAQEARLDVGPTPARRLVDTLAAIAAEVMTQRGVRGLFCTGGDTTRAVLQRLNAHGVEVESEVLPLATRGRLIGGAWSSLPIVTKGGMVGEVRAILDCVVQLEQMSSLDLAKTGAQCAAKDGGFA